MAVVVAAARFHVWTYRAPAIVLGCAQRSLRQDIEPKLEGRACLLERQSGGGAVLTGPWMVGVSVVLPHGHPWLCNGLLESYRWLGQLHVAVLADLGVAVHSLPAHELPRANEQAGRTVDWACFGSLSPWEVVDGQGRKLVGLAQRRQQTGVLVVAGTLTARPDWALLCCAMGHPQDEPVLRRRTVSCEELAGRPVVPQELASKLKQALGCALGVAYCRARSTAERTSSKRSLPKYMSSPT